LNRQGFVPEVRLERHCDASCSRRAGFFMPRCRLSRLGPSCTSSAYRSDRSWSSFSGVKPRQSARPKQVGRRSASPGPARGRDDATPLPFSETCQKARLGTAARSAAVRVPPGDWVLLRDLIRFSHQITKPLNHRALLPARRRQAHQLTEGRAEVDTALVAQATQVSCSKPDALLQVTLGP
jgi:hypothetical protein